MDIRQISYFVEIANQKSFTKAAQTLCVTQPALSKCMTNLENECGTKLFIRDSSNISLTDTGKCFYDSAKDFICHFNTLQQEVSDKKKRSMSMVHIGYSPLFSFNCQILNYTSDSSQDTCLRFMHEEQTAAKLIEGIYNMSLDIALGILTADDLSFNDHINKINTDVIKYGGYVLIKNRHVPNQSSFESIDSCPYLIMSSDTYKLFRKNTALFAGKKTVIVTDNIQQLNDKILINDYSALLPDYVLNFLPSDKYTVQKMDPDYYYNIVLMSNNNAKYNASIRHISADIIKQVRLLTG